MSFDSLFTFAIFSSFCDIKLTFEVRVFQGGRVILKTGVNMNVNLPLSLLSSSVCQLSSFSNSLVRISYDLPVIILAALFCTFLHLAVQVITAIFPN